jgi:hypothetical protein
MAAGKGKPGPRRTRTRTPKPPPPRDGPEDAFAVRIVFEYDGSKVRLASSQRVDMLVPFSDPLSGYAAEQGSWIEVRDRGGRPLYRQLLPQMIQAEVEGPSDSPGHPMTRRTVDRPRGVFVALVPDLEAAHRIALWHQPGGVADARAATREILNAPFPRGRGKAAR